MRMADDDIEERILELKEYLENYVDRRFEELLEHLSSRSETDRIKRELLAALLEKIEKLRNELMNEAKPKDLSTITEKLNELSREVETIKQLINKLSKQQLNTNNMADKTKQETALTETRLRQLVTEEIRKLEQEKHRKKARRAILLLIGAVAGAAAAIAIAYELAPWLLPLIIIAAIAWLRR